MKKDFKNKGFISIIALITLGVVLVLASYFLSFTTTELKISRSYEVSLQTYYLAEAGINEAVWKLKNDFSTADGDDAWAECFVTSTIALGCSDCNTWTDTFTKNTGNLTQNSSIQVTIKNSGCGEGEIVATSTVSLSGGKTAQRVVKTAVFKALASPTANNALMSGGSSGNVEVSSSNLVIYGNFFCKNELLNKGSWIEVYDDPLTPDFDGKILVAGNYHEQQGGSASSSAYCASNICDSTSTCACEGSDEFDSCNESSCTPKDRSLPLVDFDSLATTSFRSRAQVAQDAGQCQILCNGLPCMCGLNPCAGNNKCILTAVEFSDILWAAGEDGTTTLNNGITYVTGTIDLKGARRLIINGELIATGAVYMGVSNSWKKGGQTDSGTSHLKINRLTPTSSSGIVAQGNISFGQYSFLVPTVLTGVIYAYGNNDLYMDDVPVDLTVTGGIIGRKLYIDNVNLVSLVLDNEVLNYGLGYIIDEEFINPTFSPVITTEHWEESY